MMIRVRLLLFGTLLLSSCSGGAQARLDYFYVNLKSSRKEFNSAVAQGDVVRIQRMNQSVSRAANYYAVDLIRDVEHSEQDRRLLAIYGLGFVNQLQVRNLLVGILQDPDPLVRSTALGALGLQGIKSTSLDPIVNQLKDPVPEVRLSALFCLRLLVQRGHNNSLVPTLVDLLKVDQEGPVRAESAAVLGVLASVSSIEALIQIGMDDEFWMTKLNSANALAAMGPLAHAANRVLIDGLRDKNHDVKMGCLHALRDINALDKDTEDRLGDRPQLWKDWFDEQLAMYYYDCPVHREKQYNEPGKCDVCKGSLNKNRRIRAGEVPADGSWEYACPNHPSRAGTGPYLCTLCGSHFKPRRKAEGNDEPKSEEEPKKD